jgi:predicted DNA-binding transcriptional regulator YafY
VKDRRKLSETVARYLRMLQLVPHGRKIDAASIERALANEGIVIHRRSVQRDLELLSTSFPGLTCDCSTRPYGWSWDRNAPLLDIPSMNLQTAVTLELVRAYMALALPRTTLLTLQPYFDRARSTLDRSSSARLSRWPRKVKVVPRGQPLLAPAVSDAVLEVVYGSLLDERRFSARYRKRGAEVDKDYEVSPLGLVVRNGILVLVCTLQEEAEIKHLVLHRMRSACRLERSVRPPPGFNLQDHVQSGGAAFHYGRKLSLRLLMRKEAAITLRETPLSTDQVLREVDASQELLEATVPDTLELRAWLTSYGGLVEVLAPRELRDYMADTARAMAARYEGRAARIRPISKARPRRLQSAASSR